MVSVEQTEFIPTEVPYLISGGASYGELDRLTLDAGYYTQRVVEKLTFQKERHAAVFEAQSQISFAAAMAMAETSVYADPERLVENQEYRIIKTTETIREVMASAIAENSTRDQETLRLHLAQAMLAQLILYKPLCMYGANPYAEFKRRQLVEGAERNLAILLDDTRQRYRADRNSSSIKGSLQEISALALLNSAPHPDRLALPALGADDHLRKTDVIYVTHEPSASFQRYVQVSTTPKTENLSAYKHQAQLTGRDLGNVTDSGKRWKLADAIIRESNNTSANHRIDRDFIAKRREKVLAKIDQESTYFPLSA